MPAGKAAAVRCPSWWWVTRGTCSGSASCPAGLCRCWSRRRGSVAMWNARPSSTGTWCCSSRSCLALLWRGACARTTPLSDCRGRYRETAAASCDREEVAFTASKTKGTLIKMAGNLPPVASCFTELIIFITRFIRLSCAL